MIKYTSRSSGFALIIILAILATCLTGLTLVYEQATSAYLVAIKRYHAYARSGLADAACAYACARAHSNFDAYAKLPKKEGVHEHINNWGTVKGRAFALDLAIKPETNDRLAVEAVINDGKHELHRQAAVSRPPAKNKKKLATL